MRTEILQREIKNDRRGDPFSFRLPAFEVLQCLCDWEIIVNVDGVFSHLTELDRADQKTHLTSRDRIGVM